MTDDLDLLRTLRSEPGPPSAAVRTAARNALDRAITAEPASAAAARRRPPRRRRALVRLAACTALAVVVLAVTGLLRSGSSTQPALAAGPLLERLARVAAAQPAAVPRAGQFLYTASSSLTGSDTALPGGVYCQSVFRQYRQNWIAPNGEGLFRETDGPARYRSAKEAAACSSAPLERAGVSSTWAAPGCLSISPISLGRLPLNPATLRARLLTGKVEGGPPGAAEAFAQVGDLLRETDASPALRAALYRAAAGLHGVKSIGKVTEELGRSGVGLALDSGGARHELIFSATTSALLAERTVQLGSPAASHAKPGAVLDWSAYTAGRVVDRLPEPSPLPLTPHCIRGGSTGLHVPGRPQDTVLVGSAAAGR